MTASLIADLLADGPVLTDGAWGTQLGAGMPAGHRADVLNLTDPDRVASVAKAYVDAGSRIILTNTFQANRFALGEDAGEVYGINRAGAEISRRAADGRAKVFASIGPSNRLLFAGDTDEAELTELFGEQAAALADGGADGLVIETMSDLDEASIALAAAKATGLPVVACMTFDTGKRHDRTMMGVTPAQAAERLTDAGADVVGANCGSGIDLASPICESLAEATSVPIWMKANAGEPDFVDRAVVYRMTPDEFSDHVEVLVGAGADFVGGCCGTTPEFIAAAARRLA